MAEDHENLVIEGINWCCSFDNRPEEIEIYTQGQKMNIIFSGRLHQNNEFTKLLETRYEKENKRIRVVNSKIMQRRINKPFYVLEVPKQLQTPRSALHLQAKKV